MTICIAGKNNIAVQAVQHLISKYPQHKIVACTNATDDGRDSWQKSYRKFCLDNGIAIVDLKELYSIKDLTFICLEYDRILKPARFNTTKLYNIHFSKLPAYKGMYTSVMPIWNGEAESGVTLHRIDQGIDTGDIIDQLTFPISLDMNARDLYDKYIYNGFNLFSNNIDAIINGAALAIPQPALGSSYYSKATLDFANIRIDLNKTACEIHNQIRAFSFREYQLPEVYGSRIYLSTVENTKSVGKPGQIVDENEWYLVIETIDYRIKLYKDKETELVKASEIGDVEMYKRIKSNGYPTEVRTKKGWNALIIAAYNNQLAMVKELIKDGMDVNDTNYNGTTVLMYSMTAASKDSNLDTLKYLAERADWTLIDNSKKDIFHYAEVYGNNAVIDFVKGYRH